MQSYNAEICEQCILESYNVMGIDTKYRAARTAMRQHLIDEWTIVLLWFYW